MKNRYVPWFFLVLLLVTSIVPVIEASGENWLTGWDYRRAITIDGASSEQTNYQIRLNLHTDAGSDSNFEFGSVTNWADRAPQGVATDGTYVYTFEAGGAFPDNTISKYLQNGDFVTSRIVDDDGWTGTDLGGGCVVGDYLYITSHGGSEVGYILKYNKNDLSYVTEYDVESSFGTPGSDVAYYAPTDKFFVMGGHNVREVGVFDSSFNYETKYSLAAFSVTGTYTSYEGISFYGDYFFAPTHRGADQEVCDVWYYTGSGIEAIQRLPWVTFLATYDLTAYCSQGIDIEERGGSWYVWWATVGDNPEFLHDVAVTELLSSGNTIYELNCKSDFSDIRFTSSDGSTELDYWLEPTDFSTYVIGWAEVPIIPTGGTTIYMYYGKADATTTSSGVDTFPTLFDHFLGSSLDTDIWYVDVSDGSVTIADSIAKVQGNDGTFKYTFCSKAGFRSDEPSALRTRALLELTQASFQITQIGWSTYGVSTAGLQVKSTAGTHQVFISDSLGNQDNQAVSTDYFDAYFVYDLYRTGTQGKVYADDIEIAVGSMDPDTETFGAQLYVRDSEYDLYCDWILIREWCDPEPFCSNIGSEEEANGIVIPTVTTQSATDIAWDDGTFHATLHGTITDTGGENCDQRGFDWGYSPSSYPYDWTESGSYGTGSFSHYVSGLDGDTVYFRAKAHNSEGWGYGSELSFPAPSPENNPPTITSASISNMDDSDNLYTMKKFYSFVVVVNDVDGSVDIEKVYIQGKNGVNVLWEVRLDSLTGSGSVSIYSGSTIIDLDSETPATWEENGNEGTATFNIWLEGDHDNLANLEIAVYVEDAGGLYAGWTDKQTDYWDAINRLVTTSFVASDGRVNRGGTDTLSGTVRYATTNTGNTPSSSYPSDDQFTAVRIHDAGHTVRGSDTSISNGAFSVSVSIPDEVQSNPFHVYLDMSPDWSDGDAPDGDIVSVVGDQVHATSSYASDYRVDLEDNVDIYFTLKYDYDETLMVDGTVTIEGDSANYQGSGVWEIIQNRSTVQSVLYDEFTSAGNAHGITSVSSAGQSVSVIWDRFKVTGLWASKANPIPGESVYLYATGELAYDGHEPDVDDSLNISGVGFDWDWEEEWFYAEVNKSTPGAITYDTLTSVEEYSYGITVGTMDGNTVTVAWGGYGVTFLGLFSENGTLTGAVNVTAHLPSGTEVFEVDGQEEKGFMEVPEMFTFSLAGGGFRHLYSFQANETLYLFTPDSTYSVYSFLIRDYTGRVGRSTSYLESLRIVNGTERMVERMIIWDTANTVPLTLVQSQIYALQIRFADNTTYRFGYFIPGTDPTPTLSLYDIAFSDQAHLVTEHITVEAQRPADTHIRVNYKDELDDTEEVFVEVCLLNGTQIWNDTGAADILQFNWYGADNETDYMVNVEMTHGFYGELTYTKWLAGAQVAFEDPFDLTLFGDWPITGAFAVFIIIGTACLFSRGSAVIGMGATVLVAAALAGIGWIAINYTVLAICFALVVMWGLGGAK